MRGPKLGIAIFDRQRECAEAMEDAVRSMITIAINVGWTENEACVATAEIADLLAFLATMKRH